MPGYWRVRGNDEVTRRWRELIWWMNEWIKARSLFLPLPIPKSHEALRSWQNRRGVSRGRMFRGANNDAEPEESEGRVEDQEVKKHQNNGVGVSNVNPRQWKQQQCENVRMWRCEDVRMIQKMSGGTSTFPGSIYLVSYLQGPIVFLIGW